MKKIDSLTVVIVSTPRPCIGRLLCELPGQPYDELIVEIGHTSLSKGRNVALKKVQTSHVLFLDDDVSLAPNTIAKGREQMEAQSVEYGQSKIVGGIENSPNKFIGAAQWWHVESLQKLGGFDEDFPFFNEDLVMGHVAEQAHFERGFFDRSFVFHYGLGNFEKLVEGNAVLKNKYPELYEDLRSEIR